jgi:hypothetical protein
MSDRNAEHIRTMLQEAMPPWTDTELKRDLWPEMLRRIDEQPAGLGWLDYLLAAALSLCVFLYPELVPSLLYHL